MYAIADFDFDETGIDMNGIECGMFEGTAHIDEDGQVVALSLIGWRGKAKITTDIELALPYRPMTWEQKIAFAIAETLQRNYSGIIKDALADYQEACGVREFEAVE